MEKRHDDALTNRLEEILTNGCTYISWNELYLWYGVQKLAVRTYRDLAERWDEIASGAGDIGEAVGRLSFVQSPMNKVSPGMFLFGSKMPQVIYDYGE